MHILNKRVSLLAAGTHSTTTALAGLVHQRLVNVRNDAAAGNRRLDERVELFVAADRQLQVPGGDALDLQVLAGVAGQLEDFGGQVLQDRRCVDRRRGSHAVPLVDGVLEEAVDAAHRKLQTGLGRARLRRFLGRRRLAALAALASLATFARLVRQTTKDKIRKRERER
jgi:hypothetical protein